MDNLAHTLAGLALAEAGLKRRTGLATATLAIAANLPDVDALIYLVGDGPDALAFRRGWTHGPIAMVVLPVLLTGIMLLWSRALRGGPGHRRTPVSPGWLFIIALIGVLSHPLLDVMNSYGVRLLMPFSDRWFYGDALFIIDPWLWLTLGVGIVVSRWRGRRTREASTGVALARGRSSREVPTDAQWATRPARVAIVVLVIYAGVMLVTGRVARQIVERQAGDPAVRAMAGPVAVTPFRRQIVRDLGESYESGELTFGPGPRYTMIDRVQKQRDVSGVSAAARTDDGAAFLTWARFPYFITEQVGDSIRVRMSDARYADALGRGWASVVVTVPASGP
jgi:inner membrane protein